jgi:hypothetical protein
MLTLMVGGSLVAGSNDPQCGTSMPLGPSTPSVCVDFHSSIPISFTVIEDEVRLTGR